jgi:putative endonuclease
MKEFAYVYILEFLAPEGEFYVGLTDNPSARRAKHNEGGVPHTAKRRPCQIKTAIVFRDRRNVRLREVPQIPFWPGIQQETIIGQLCDHIA